LKTKGGDWHEPRLMAKVDDPEQLPNVLREAGYSLLAVTNGSYLVFQGDVFIPVPDCSIESVYNPRTDFPLETIGRGTGEAEYLDNAFNMACFLILQEAGFCI